MSGDGPAGSDAAAHVDPSPCLAALGSEAAPLPHGERDERAFREQSVNISTSTNERLHPNVIRW